MAHWVDDAARGLAAGTHSRRDVLRFGGKAAGAALLATLATPIGAFAAGKHKCPHGHSCGSNELCCRNDCCETRTEQCCEGRCVAKARTCCRIDPKDEGRVCRPHEECCGGVGSLVSTCYDPREKECCFKPYGQSCLHGQCCGTRECCERKHCCDHETCCSTEKPKCCKGGTGRASEATCCAASETCCQTPKGWRCCGPGQVCCGGQCCNKLDCVGEICEGSGNSTCVQNCPPNTKCCDGDCANTTLAPTGYYNTICCQPTPTSPNGSTIGCNQIMGVTGSGCKGGIGGCICADGSFCPATQQCCYQSGCCPPGKSCGIFTHTCA